MLKRGFISRSASAVTLVSALALLSSISGVTAGTIDDNVSDAQLSPSSLVFSSTSAGGFSYSRWLQNQGTGAVADSDDSASADDAQADQGQAPITYGSFVLTETPLERIYGNVKDSWTDTFSNIVTRAADTSLLRGWAMDYVTGQDVDMQANIDSWWDQRRSDTTGIFVGMADVLTDNVFQVGEEHTGGLSFIRSLDWDYQTELGGRPWQFGVNAIGSLREADDDVVLWQLRGFTAKDSKGGANAGLIYRRAQEDTTMLGVNAFLDYESHDYGDFFRWSVGGEIRTEWLDFYGNRYIGITDPRLQSDTRYAYTKDGLDLEVAFHVPDMRWLSGHVTYYKWDGQFGQADDKGFRYGVRMSPPMAENLRLELELDDQEGGDLDVGGRVSYRHEFGGVPAGTRTASTSSSFDPRDYFFEPVRREYAQRIGLSDPTGVKASIGPIAPAGTMMKVGNVVVTPGSPYYFFPTKPITVRVSGGAGGTNIAGISGNGFAISLNDGAAFSFEEGGEIVSLTMGSIASSGDSPKGIRTPNTDVAFIGTVKIDISVGVKTVITLDEGGISLKHDDQEGIASLDVVVNGNASVYFGDVTYYACNDGVIIENGVKFTGVTTSPEDCQLMVTDSTFDGIVEAAVNYPKNDLVIFDVSKGIGKYALTINDLSGLGYFEVVEYNSNTFYISVTSVPENQDGKSHVIEWKLEDEGEATGDVKGTITVNFTKSPIADNAFRFAGAGTPYSDTIVAGVRGGNPDATNGYTFALAANSRAGYSLESPTGFIITLNADSVDVPTAGSHFVTVSIHDGQNYGTFVLEVSVVDGLTFEPDSATAIEGVEEVIDLTPYAMGGNLSNADVESELSFMVYPAKGGFNVGDDNMLTVAATVSAGDYIIPIVVKETNPAQERHGEIAIGVSAVLSASEEIPSMLVPVSLTAQIGQIAASGGIGDYTFALTNDDDYNDYFTINSSLGWISVMDVPSSQAGSVYALAWTLDDGDDRSPEVNGTVTVQFTEAPIAASEFRFAGAGTPYSAMISANVIGGVPGDDGYTFTLVGNHPDYSVNSPGTILVLIADGVDTPEELANQSYFVTVSIFDGQTPPQTGTFVLEVGVVSGLTFETDSVSDAIEGVVEVIDLTPYAAGGNIGNADAESELSFMVSPAVDGFNVGSDNMLTVAATVPADNYIIAIDVRETNPAHEGRGVITISVADALSAEQSVPSPLVPVNLTTEVAVITPEGGIGGYTFALTDNSGYFTIDNNGLIIVSGAPETEDGNSYTLAWALNDEDDRSPEVNGTVIVQFTKAPVAASEFRFAGAGTPYIATISANVIGGEPGEDGYTLSLASDAPAGYTLVSTAGSVIVLIASVASPTDSDLVTVGITDSQGQSGTFVLEVSVVSGLTFAPVTVSSAIEGIEEMINLTPLASGGNIGNADAESDLSFRVDPATDGFNVIDNNMLIVANTVGAGVYTVSIVVSETNPVHEGQGAITISVAEALTASGPDTAVVPVELRVEVGQITPEGGIGDYTFAVVSDDSIGENGEQYLSINEDGAIIVDNAPESYGEIGSEREFVLVWSLNDGDDRSPVVIGTVTGFFTKAPSAENAVRYNVEGADYSDRITVDVVGGVPHPTIGYTFELVDDPVGYSLDGITTGLTLVLIARNVSVPSTGQYVTVSIHDSQDPRQSGTFELEVIEVSVLTFAPDSATSAIEGEAEMIDLTPYAKGGNVGNADAESDLSFRVDPPETGFNVGADNILTVAADVSPDVYTIPIIVSETNPVHQGTGEIVITVTGSLSIEDGITKAVVPVELEAEVGTITPTGGIGDYTFVLTDDVKGYFTINSSLGVISVINAPEGEDGKSYVLSWTLNDGDSRRSPEVTGKVSVTFTKAPSAENAVRYAVVDQVYSDTINIPVVGGVRDSAVGYTLVIAGSPTGYSLGSPTGTTIELIAAATYTDAGVNYVTVSVYDSQDPPQSGTFVLEVRVVSVLAIAAPASALEIFQTESESLLSLVSGGNTDYNEETNERTFEIVEGNDDDDFSIDNNGVLEVGASAPTTVLATLKVAVAETVPLQNATVDVVVSVKFKASDVALDTSVFPATIDPDVDIPLAITMETAGGYGVYTYSIENAPSYISLTANVLVVSSPGEDTSASFNVKVEDNSQTFPAGVSNTDEEAISFEFKRPPAEGSEVVGDILINGGGGDGTYGTGSTFTFDPKAAGGVTVDVQEDGNTAKVELENGDIVVNAKYVASGSLNPATSEWIFFSAREIAILVSTGVATYDVAGISEGIAFTDATGNDLAEAYNTPGMVAILVGSADSIADIDSSVRYVACAFSKFGATPGAWSCTVEAPSSTNTATRSLQSISPAAESPSTETGNWPWGSANTFWAHFPTLLPRYATPEADCAVASELANCANKLAIIAGSRSTFLPIELTERDDVQFFPYGGEWVFFGENGPTDTASLVRLEAEFTLEYETNCMVTLPDSSVCTDSSSSSASFASIGS